MQRLWRAETSQVSQDARAAAIAARQFGVISRDQAFDAGVTRDAIRHRIRTGRWQRVNGYVFRLGGTGQAWHQSLMIACLSWGDGSVVSHRSAGALSRLVGCNPGIIELTIPRDRRRRGPGIVHRNALESFDVGHIDGIPVTRPARTLFDLAQVTSRDAVEEALDDALRRGLVSLTRMRWRLERFGRGRPGVLVMRALLDARDSLGPVPESVFETRLLRLIRRAGLPEPQLQHEIIVGDGSTARADFAYPDAKLVIEADGFRWHRGAGRLKWQRDLERNNVLMLLGWRVVHVTWEDVAERPDVVVDSIRAALAQR